MRTGWTCENRCVWIGSRAYEKYPLKGRRNGSSRQWKTSFLRYHPCSCTSNALQPRFPPLADLGAMNHFFNGKELGRWIHSAVCDRHCLAHQAEDFSLVPASDRPWLYLLADNGDVITGALLPLLLPLYYQLANKPSQNRCPERHWSCYIAPCGNTTLYAVWMTCNKKPLLSTGAQWPSQRKEGFPSLTSMHPSSLQALAFEPCMCPPSILRVAQPRCHLLVVHLCNAAFHLS